MPGRGERFYFAAREIVMKDFPNCVANVGKMEFAPGASNIVPARADLLLEFRSPDEDQLSQIGYCIIGLALAERSRTVWAWSY